MKDYREKIKKSLEESNINNLKDSKKDELIEKLNIYHEELYFQNEELKKSNVALEEMTQNYKFLFEKAPFAYFIIDDSGIIIDYNLEMKNMFSDIEKNSKIYKYISHESQDIFYFMMKSCKAKYLKEDNELSFTYSGQTYYVRLLMDIQKNQDGVFYQCSIIDMTQLILYKRKIEYLSYHDQLTGLYNRRFFEEELKRLDTKRNTPLGIIVADLNGIKNINNAVRHTIGDEFLLKASKILKSHCRKDEIIARVGGDEFAIIVPKISNYDLFKLNERLNRDSENISVNDLNMSISYGCAIKERYETSIIKVYSEAEKSMYSNKLYQTQNNQRHILDTILSTLHEKHPREELHSRRVSRLMEIFSNELCFDTTKTTELKTMGLLHDIGKIAIDYSVLDVPGKLTDEQFNEIKKHPEIGYRILKASGLFGNILEIVLSHHERPDGLGYPRKLTSRYIPKEARMLAICDAYDAMVSQRPYRRPLSKDEAIKELNLNKKSQFDPDLTDIFIDKILKKYEL